MQKAVLKLKNLTVAQKAMKLLAMSGIESKIIRLSKNECANGLKLDFALLSLAEKILTNNGIAFQNWEE